MIKTVILESSFSSAHLYHQQKWSVLKNQQEFGRCFTEYGHGHNYKLLSEWKTDIDILSLRSQVEQIVQRLDHEHLNYVIEEFKSKIPTTENICDYLRIELAKTVNAQLLSLELFEDHDIGAKWIHP